MGRGAAAAGQRNAEAGASQNSAYSGRAGDVYNTLFPQLQQQAQQGMNPADQAALNTASQQSLGGAQAGAVGQGALLAARTRNAGAGAPAIAESARSGERQNSQNALGAVGKSIAMKQAAMDSLGKLYGTSAEAGNSALQGSNSAIGQWNQADANTMAWTKMFVDAASNVGAAKLGA